MESDETELTATIEVHTRLAPDGDPFYEMENLRKLESASLVTWRDMDSEERKALIVVLRDAMEGMLTDPEAWLPGSLVLESDQRIQVVLTFQVGKMKDTVALMRRRREQHRIEQRDDMVAMRRDLADGK